MSDCLPTLEDSEFQANPRVQKEIPGISRVSQREILELIRVSGRENLKPILVSERELSNPFECPKHKFLGLSNQQERELVSRLSGCPKGSASCRGVCLRGAVLAVHRPADRPCQLALGAVVGCLALARAGPFCGARAVIRAVEAILVAGDGGRLAS